MSRANPEKRVLNPVVELPARANSLDCWVVVAWWHAGHWKVFPDQWINEQAARIAADKLPSGYTRRLIFNLLDRVEKSQAPYGHFPGPGVAP